jgi:hypothetical protein
MATSMDAEARRALATKHGMCEVARDWDGALATMVPEPFYVMHPWGLHISGRDAIVEMWSRFFTPEGAIYPFSGKGTVPGSHTMREYFGDDTYMQVTQSTGLLDDGSTQQKNQIVEFVFEGDLVLSETLWASRYLVPYLDEVFDESFRAMPGVVEL